MRYLIFISLFLLSCSSKPKNKNRYFEGEIHYEISYQLYDETVRIEDVKKRSGEKFIYSFKEGKTRKDYYYENNLIKVRIYDPKENLNSMFYPGWDTIYQYTPHGKDFNLIEYTNVPDTIIDGRMLEGIKVISKFITKEAPNLIYTWYFDKSLKINPDWFKESKEGNWHQLMADKKSLVYFYTIDDKTRYKQTFKTSKIINTNITDSKFDLPKLPIRKID